MHRNILLIFTVIIYYALVLYALFSFNAGLLVTSLLLFGLPAYLLARYSAAPTQVLIAVMTFGAGIAILLEGIAHIYGIWYTLGVDELRLFGLIPLEVIFAIILQTLFMVLVYEFIFDDGEYKVSSARIRFSAFGVFSISVFLFIAIHQYLLNGIFFTHSYIWIIGAFVAATLGALTVQRTLSFQFFKRLCAFTSIAGVPLLMGMFLSVTNAHKLFTYTHDYLYTYTFFGHTLPVEEILLTLTLPFFVATFYELYLDDGK
jgi:hypothetical protein